MKSDWRPFHTLNVADIPEDDGLTVLMFDLGSACIASYYRGEWIKHTCPELPPYNPTHWMPMPEDPIDEESE